MKPSAQAMFSIAKSRAFSTMSKPLCAEIVRVTASQKAAVNCQKIAASVWSAVRVVLVSEPSFLTSL
jgi:hypothetical protein